MSFDICSRNNCEIKITDDSTDKHIQNSTFCIKDTESFPNANISLLPPVKKKITTHLNNDKNEQLYHTEE